MASNIFFTPRSGDYVLDIPEAGFTINDQNSEFSDGIFVNWTYPLTVFLTDEQIRIFGNPANPTSNNKKRKDDGFLYIYGELLPAKIYFQSSIMRETKCQFEIGVGSLDVFEKKLSEIDMGEFPVAAGQTIYDFVDANLGKTYPEINYCFPNIFAPKKDFQDMTNNRYATLGYNQINISTSKIHRSTLDPVFYGTFLKPTVFLLHMIKCGFETEGFEVTGEIFQDEDFNQTALNHNTIVEEEITYDVKKMSIFYSGIDPYNFTRKENFDIIGSYYVSVILPNQAPITRITVTNVDTNEELYYYEKIGQEFDGETIPSHVSVIFELPVMMRKTTVEYKLQIGNVTDYGVGKLFDMFLNPKFPDFEKLFGARKSLKIAQFTPDITFGDLLKAIKKIGNYKMDIVNGNEINFKKVLNSYPTQYVDLEFSEQENKEVVNKTVDLFIFKHGAPEELKLPEMIITEGGVMYTGENAEDQPMTKNKNTETIEFGCYPMNMAVNFIGGNTAMEEAEEVDGVALLKYTGWVYTGNPSAPVINNTQLLHTLKLPIVFHQRYQYNIHNRLTADTIKWKFYTKKPEAKKLSSGQTIFAYNCFHKAVSLVKTYMGNEILEVQLETLNRY